MTVSVLNIESPQLPTDRPSVDLAISRTRAFLKRHQRMYGIPNIQAVNYSGTIDK